MKAEFFIIREKISRIIRRNFRNVNGTILDIGCGNDPQYHKLIGGRIIGLDKSGTERADVEWDANKGLPFAKSHFDAVISINSLYYLDDPRKVLEEAARVLKKGGTLFILAPFIYPLHDAPYDKYRFTEYGLKEIVGKDFIVKESGTVGGIFNVPAVVIHSAIKGARFMLPKSLGILSPVLKLGLYPFYFLAQSLSLLDVFDNTGRWATYCYVSCRRK